MRIRADEISALISQEIRDFDERLKLEKVGTVVSVGDGIAQVYGLRDVMAAEMLLFPGNIYGLALNLEETMVGVILLGDYNHIKEGDIVKCTGRVLEVPVGHEVRGRVINPVGLPLDGKGEIKAKEFYPLERIAPNVAERQSVKEPLQTGIKAIDSMIPLGRGQRELVLGDRGTGKTTIFTDTMLNQANILRQRLQNGNKNNLSIAEIYEIADEYKIVYGIYVFIGQRNSLVAKVIDELKKDIILEYKDNNGSSVDFTALDLTTIVHASASDHAALQYIAPYAGCAIGEEIRDRGGHAVVFYDDLTSHGWAYRQISLLLRRPPGREAYPGDIFYLHSRLLERAAKLSDEKGGGSLTALPIVETQLSDITTYIPTNLISITDGQIYLKGDLFYAGIRPAIDVGLSVSRVGGNAQIPAMRQVAGGLRLQLAQYYELKKFAQFAGELSPGALAQLDRGTRLVEVFKQYRHCPMAVDEQIFIINAVVAGHLDGVPLDEIKNFETVFIAFTHHKDRRTDKEFEKEYLKHCKTYQKFFKAYAKQLKALKILFKAINKTKDLHEKQLAELNDITKKLVDEFVKDISPDENV